MNPNQQATWGTRLPLTITQADALAAVIAYAFGRTSTGRSLYAYATYDAALRGNPDPIEAAIHAANGLNANMSAADILELTLLHERGLLPDLRQLPPFWTWPGTGLITNPRDGSPASALWDWYEAVTNIKGLGGAASSKTGHHLASWVAPLSDSLVGKAWSNQQLWCELHTQLGQQAQWCVDLERGVETYRQTVENGFGIALTRLRIVDIIMWLEARGDLHFAIGVGQQLLAGIGWQAW